jgi:TP53 regulating kinase-like protein
MLKQLSSGAESIVYVKEKGVLLKDRMQKGYRIPEIDVPLRKSRTKRELKVLESLKNAGANVPHIIAHTDTHIEMQHIEGIVIKYLLDDSPLLAEKIGEQLTMLHDHGIIHGDLTTSNMILGKNKKLYLIDFGLSFFSQKIEDMAVDIHLFKQALESRHHRVQEKAYHAFLKGYNPKQKKAVLERVAAVEKRGRYKEKT